MTFAISDWNVNPNLLWFVKIIDDGSDMLVGLFRTLADAQANSNRVAYMNSPFGTDESVVLVDDNESVISYFNDALAYHLKVSGADSDTAKIFQVSPFVDLPDINNSIYRSESLIQQKAINEINKHTHIATRRDMGIANHIPLMKVGEVCRINSNLRNMDVLTTIDDLNIIGTKEALINQIGTVQYTDLNYG